MKLEILDENWSIRKHVLFAGEPGVTRVRKAQQLASSGRGVSLAKYLDEYLEAQKSDVFRTVLPNLDVKHDKNFTGPKRGKNRRYELEGWGTLYDIIKRHGRPE
jgi:hypothetical protein